MKGRLRKRIRPDVGSQEEESEKELPKTEQLAHECCICGKVYARKFKLSQHQRLEHTIIINRQCLGCMNTRKGDPLWREKKAQAWGNKPQPTAEEMRRYLSSLVHEINPRPQRHQIIFNSKCQAYHQCTVCFKIMIRCWHNQGHQHQHGDTGVPATLGFQCEDCMQLFKNKKTMQRHRSHTCPALSHDMAEMVSMKNRCEWCFRLMPSERLWKRHLLCHGSLIRSLSGTATTTTSTSASKTKTRSTCTSTTATTATTSTTTTKTTSFSSSCQ